jgi:ABC-2 type transport system ATP-binding protein
MVVTWNDNAPIYRQLRDRVVAMILDGVLKQGDALPSVRQVAADFQLNPITVSKAYQELVDEQLVEKRRGLGMYVSEERTRALPARGMAAAARAPAAARAGPVRADGDRAEGGRMSAVISARGLDKKYRNSHALRAVDFEVPAGRIVGLVGPNGAGKTTALKAILGLTDFDGELSVLGRDPRRERHALMQDVCFIADVAVLPRWLRVADAVRFVEGVHPRFSRAKCEAFLARTKIKPNARVKELSKGMIVQLHLALVMAIDAKLLVLDEPTLGLDIIYRKDFYQTLLNDYFDHEKTIVITTHQIEEVEHILTDLLFIQDGRIALSATMDEVGERFTEVMVNPDRRDAALALKPLHERQVFGKSIFLFDGVPRERAAALGELHKPSVADIFVATMRPRHETMQAAAAAASA